MDENAILKKNILSFSKLNTISEDEIKNIYQTEDTKSGHKHINLIIFIFIQNMIQ